MLPNERVGMEQVGLKLTDLNTARRFGGSCAGNINAALVFGGFKSPRQQKMNLGMDQVGLK